MQKEHLVETVERCLDVFDGKRQKNKFLAFGLKLVIALLSAAITVLLGLSYPNKPETTYKNVALGLSALSAVMGTWDAFFNHRTLWIRYTIAANRMRSLLEDIRYETAKNQGVLPTAMADEMFGKYQEIVGEANHAWEDMRKQEPGEHLQPPKAG
jgi:hypothetical protein